MSKKHKPRLLASAADEAGILRLIKRFYGGTEFRLDGEKLVRSSDGKVPTGVRVVLSRGRYRFEDTEGPLPGETEQNARIDAILNARRATTRRESQ